VSIVKKLLLLLLLAPPAAFAQNAQLTGIVKDPSGAAIRKATVTLTNQGTGATSTSTTNEAGFYTFASAAAGTYIVSAEAKGFSNTRVENVRLETNGDQRLDIEVKIEHSSQTVTVQASTVNMNTDNASVSTVVDQALISELPLNGRSLDTLFLLTPGIVPSGTQNAGGQYSVNGQRSSGNNLTIDGASGNVYENPVATNQRGQAGSTYAVSASGGTNGLLPVDAIEEYRIQTSTYSAEFGRSPGGQIQIRTRGGTNQFHGSAFEYFRNQVMDATDWFVKYNGLTQASLRMNDFGGTFGGPVLRNRLFVFASHETLFLDQPNNSSYGVPSAYARQIASSTFAPFIAAYPNGNGGTATTAKYPSYTDTYNTEFGVQVVDHSTSVRLDADLPHGYKGFFRFSIAPSASSLPAWYSNRQAINLNAYTLGLTKNISASMLNNATFNITTNNGRFGYSIHPVDGADPSGFNQFCSANATGIKPIQCGVTGLNGWGNLTGGTVNSGDLNQFNLVDTFRWHIGNHSLALGADFRHLSTTILPSTTNSIYIGYTSGPSALTGSILDEVYTSSTNNSQTLTLDNLSLFAQDDWHVNNRLTINYGIRWEYNPPISDGHGGPLAITGDPNNFGSLQAAPSGTPLYKTTHTNFAPRLGAAYQLRQDSHFATVLRIGAGVFYDTGQAATTVGSIANSYPYTINASQLGVPMAQLNFQALQQNAAQLKLPVSTLYVVSPNLTLPYVSEWNVALEQQMFGQSSVSVTYLGASGENLASTKNAIGISPALIKTTGHLYLLTNEGIANYQALQLQATIRTKQLDGVLAYTYGHNIDNGSSDFTSSLAYAKNYRSNADDDVRHVFSEGLSFKPTGLREQPVLHSITSGWVLNAFTHLQTASPLSVMVSYVGNLPPTERSTIAGFADRVSGVPVYLHQSIGSSSKAIPGGIELNPAAFTTPPTDSSGNLLRDGDSGRNNYRLFGLNEFDLSAGRRFPVTDRIGFEFKVEAFNVLNTPNFANVDTTLGQVNFGQGQNTAAGYNGIAGGGGLNTVFQSGGPRNLQLTARLSF